MLPEEWVGPSGWASWWEEPKEDETGDEVFGREAIESYHSKVQELAHASLLVRGVEWGVERAVLSVG